MSKRNWNFDWWLLVPVAILVILGLTALFSISVVYFKSQLIFLVISVFVFIFFSFANYKIFQLYGLYIYIFSIIALFFVLILGIETRGSVRWIEFLGFRIQFSEILKPFLAISFSSLLLTKKNNFKQLLSVLLFLFPILFLIFLQPDLGNTLIYFFVAILTLIFFGFSYRYFISGLVGLAICVPFLWNFLHQYQKQRIISFLNPSSDPLGNSYNAIQSLITVGSGMFLGKGLGLGTQSILSFLPEKHTDFIFATISEQIGFFGDFFIIVCFGLILYRIFLIYQRSDDDFCRIFSAVCFFIILVQFFINIGMNIGMIPIVGVTLPFVSYGGSSLLSNFILLGLLSAINTSQKKEEIFQIR
jgi:rod shape determining protein RodA